MKIISSIAFCFKILISSSKKYFFILLLVAIISSLTPFALLFFTSNLIQFLSDNVNNGNFIYRDLLFIVASISLISLFNKSLEYLKIYFDGLLNDLADKKMEELLMNKSAMLDLSFFDSAAFYNELQDSNLNKSYAVSTSFCLIDLMKLFIQLMVSVAYLSRFSLIWSLLLSVSIIPNVLLLKKQYEAIYHMQRDNLYINRKKQYTSSLLQTREFVQEIKTYNLLAFLTDKYRSLFEILYSKKKKTTFKYAVLLTISSILPEAVSLFIIASLCLMIFSNNISIGNFIYYQGIVNQIIAVMFSVVLIMSRINDGSNRINNLIKFLGWENTVNDDGKLLLSNPHTIEFRDVSFKYGEALPYVLKKLCLTIHTNKKTAFVGVNGSGKSTIIKLLLRFYDPCEGKILIDNVDLKEYSIKSVREYFSIMLQDYGKYAFTIKESVSISDDQNSDNVPKTIEALKKSGAYRFVEPLKNNIDTYLTRQYDDGGIELSGGQWQSLALSRAFFRENSGMIILDEPSSSLDAEAEAELFKKFEQLYSNKGVIIISHRLSNISSADNIYVLHDGCVIEYGTHEQLINFDGKYASMFRLQAQKYDVRV